MAPAPDGRTVSATAGLWPSAPAPTSASAAISCSPTATEPYPCGSRSGSG
jgi:hypothetical protein